MNRLFAALGAALFLLMCFTGRPAQAVQPADWTVDPAVLMDDTSAAFAPNGPSAPAVAWDDLRGRYVMVFEYMSAATDPTCPHGIWGLGLATSPDGIVWTVADANTATAGVIDPIFQPTPGSGLPHSCVAAHPTVIWRYPGGTANYNRLTVFFKAEKDTSTCGATPVEQCVYQGISRAVVSFRPNGNVRSVQVLPTVMVPITGPFGFSNTAYLASQSEFLILVEQGFDIYKTYGRPNLGWDPLSLAQSPGADSWNQDELFNPELVCLDNGDIVSFQGGRTFGAGTAISEAGWGLMTSSDLGLTWSLDPAPQFTWFNDLEWRHWSTLRVDVDEYQLWFAEKDPGTGHLRIRYAATTTTPGTPFDKLCP